MLTILRDPRPKLVAAAVALVIFVAFVFAPSLRKGEASGGVSASPSPPPRAAAGRQAGSRKYSQFPHDIKAHRAECSTCHKFPSANWKKVRKTDDAFPDITDYPQHASCVNCHKQQFFSGRPPVICSICHVNPGPRNSARHPFPNPREIFDTSTKGRTAESDFSVKFPHAVHVDIVTGSLRKSRGFTNVSWATSMAAEESCAVCHKTISPQGDSTEEYLVKPPADLGDAFWLKKGTFKSSPIGHTNCFTCHNAESGLGPAPSDCATCHKYKEPIGPADFDIRNSTRMGATTRVLRDAWSTRTSSGTFRHEFASHAELSCSACHDVNAIVTNDQKMLKVPITSCNMCHITATTDDGGILNYEIEQRRKNSSFQCIKCHLVFGTRPIPETHLKAVADAGK